MAKFMQIIEKKVNYKQNNIDLTLLDTSFRNLTKEIENHAGDTIRNIQNLGFFSNSLLLDLKTQQDNLKSSFDSWESDILTNFGISISGSFTYATLTGINAGDPADYTLLDKIINNEKYLYERMKIIDHLYTYLNTNIYNRSTRIEFEEIKKEIPDHIKRLDYTYKDDIDNYINQNHNSIKDFFKIEYLERLNYSYKDDIDNYIINSHNELKTFFGENFTERLNYSYKDDIDNYIVENHRSLLNWIPEKYQQLETIENNILSFHNEIIEKISYNYLKIQEKGREYFDR